ncbi:hypothetical protein VV02_15735 [Luteipulveratus mongoliensis]|uniref:Uncharacterized protein n=1 Tax=Luteipulveratus mongoliensis TaxID=571913 RepID=A0A0K1JJT6_9MICO|nr:hypothetical protein VV02_15735 [Luteipulveratus mongoliensis]
MANLRSGPTSYSGVSCTSLAGLTRKNSVASLNLPGVLTGGAVSTTSKSISDARGRTAEATSTVGAINLLKGAVTAKALSTKASSTVSLAGAASGTNSMTLVGLTIGGRTVGADVSPNTTLALNVGGKPLAKVVINEQGKTTVNGLVRAYTRALHVTVNAKNTLGLPIGAEIVVGQSSAALNAVPAGFATGNGYALKATLLNGTVKSGPHAYMSVPCAGGAAHNSTADGSVPGLVSAGVTTVDTKSTTVPSTKTDVNSTIASASVLGGLVKATGIKAETSASRLAPMSPVVTTDTSKFLSVKVAGLPAITGAVAPNTKVRVPGLGSVTFHKVEKTATGIRVTMVYIVLEKLLGNLPTNSVVELGVSESGVR